jgi:hypothetical protein
MERIISTKSQESTLNSNLDRGDLIVLDDPNEHRYLPIPPESDISKPQKSFTRRMMQSS